MISEISDKQDKIHKMKLIGGQAFSDKIELMRDLATYQTNFAQETNFRTHMLKYYKYVNEIRQKLDRITSGNNADNWLEPKLSQNLLT